MTRVAAATWTTWKTPFDGLSRLDDPTCRLDDPRDGTAQRGARYATVSVAWRPCRGVPTAAPNALRQIIPKGADFDRSPAPAFISDIFLRDTLFRAATSTPPRRAACPRGRHSPSGKVAWIGLSCLRSGTLRAASLVLSSPASPRLTRLPQSPRQRAVITPAPACSGGKTPPSGEGGEDGGEGAEG